MRRLKKKIFLSTFGASVALLGVVRWAFPGVTGRVPDDAVVCCLDEEVEPVADTLRSDTLPHIGTQRVYNRVTGVYSYEKCFSDLQEVQIVAAEQWGVPPIRNRQEAEHRKDELVYVGMSPYYDVDSRMTQSIPYLVPRAGLLLRHIGRTFMDSLDMKGIPLHRIIVSSVLRTEEDVERLRRYNSNASEQSCHRYGTTFDIAYNRYNPVYDPAGPKRRTVRDDTLKWVLSEVLRDCRAQGRCYVKHERKQGCFHITVR